MRELTPFGIFPPAAGRGQSFPNGSGQWMQPQVQQQPQFLIPAPGDRFPVPMGATQERSPGTWIAAGVGLAILVGGAIWLASKAREDRLEEESGFYVMLYDGDATAGKRPLMYRGPFDSHEDADEVAEKFRDNWTTIIEWSDSTPSV